MLALLRFLIVLLILQTLVYFTVSLRLRKRRRERLDEEWNEQDMSGDHEAYLDQGVDDYMDKLRKWLLLLIYVLPIIVVGVFIHLSNSL